VPTPKNAHGFKVASCSDEEKRKDLYGAQRLKIFSLEVHGSEALCLINPVPNNQCLLDHFLFNSKISRRFAP